MKFSFRIEDLELRSCGEHLLVDGVEHNRAEIVKWANDKDKKEFYTEQNFHIEYVIFSSIKKKTVLLIRKRFNVVKSFAFSLKL